MCYLRKLLVLTFLRNIHINWNKYVKKVILSLLYTRWINMEFLEVGLLKRMLNIFREGGASRTVTNITRSMVNWKKKKKKNPSHVFIDTEQLSKMQISLQVFFTDFVDRLGTTTLKMDFFWKILLIVSVTYSVFFGQTGTHIEPTKAPPWLEKFSKYVSSDTLKMHSLALFVLRFLCKTFLQIT